MHKLLYTAVAPLLKKEAGVVAEKGSNLLLSISSAPLHTTIGCLALTALDLWTFCPAIATKTVTDQKPYLLCYTTVVNGMKSESQVTSMVWDDKGFFYLCCLLLSFWPETQWLELGALVFNYYWRRYWKTWEEKLGALGFDCNWRKNCHTFSFSKLRSWDFLADFPTLWL